MTYIIKVGNEEFHVNTSLARIGCFLGPSDVDTVPKYKAALKELNAQAIIGSAVYINDPLLTFFAKGKNGSTVPICVYGVPESVSVKINEKAKS